MRFTDETRRAIDEVFRQAHAEGRSLLYEHEVYRILALIGLEVPRFVMVGDPAEVDARLLGRFGQDIVVKIVSPQIPHKQKLGGVKVVRNHDPLFVQFVLTRMRAEVLAHFPPEDQPEIKGYVLVEYVPHTQALGNELLIGIKEDPAFGPVLSLSKGGDDAEFFARYFDPANLFLPPLDYDDALKQVNTLHIRHKYEQTGHPEYLEFTARALATMSQLAYHYSFIAENRPAFILKTLDVNPFVITKDDRLVAIDGYAEFIPSDLEQPVKRGVNLDGIERFFKPKGIAVVGVSADPAKYSLGREIAHLLHDLGRDDLFLINQKGGTIRFGDATYPLHQDLRAVPGEVDLVIYAAPAQYSVDFLRSLEAKPRAVILIPGIPANFKYAEFAKQLEAALPPGVRVIGPNCMGVYHAPEGAEKGLNTFFLDEKRLEIKHSTRSNTVLLTQSGALAVTAVDKYQNSRIFKSIVSFGNKLDVKLTDLMAYFAREDAVKLIAMYIEGLDPGEGCQLFRLAREIEKPILAYKSGRTEAGARAAASHTASMSGSYDAFKAACLQAGVVLAESLDDYYHYLRVFSLLAERIPASNRVAGVVNAGFESTVGADELRGLQQAQLGGQTIARLNEINRFGLVDTNTPFLDITPMADDRMYADFVEAVLMDENVDCVFVAIIPHAASLKTIPENCRDQDSLANLLVALSEKYKKPMVVSVNAGRYYQDFVTILEAGGLPVYADIRSAIKSLDTFVSYHMERSSSRAARRS